MVERIKDFLEDVILILLMAIVWCILIGIGIYKEIKDKV